MMNCWTIGTGGYPIFNPPAFVSWFSWHCRVSGWKNPGSVLPKLHAILQWNQQPQSTTTAQIDIITWKTVDPAQFPKSRTNWWHLFPSSILILFASWRNYNRSIVIFHRNRRSVARTGFSVRLDYGPPQLECQRSHRAPSLSGYNFGSPMRGAVQSPSIVLCTTIGYAGIGGIGYVDAYNILQHRPQIDLIYIRYLHSNIQTFKYTDRSFWLPPGRFSLARPLQHTESNQFKHTVTNFKYSIRTAYWC